jgi:integrase/recombinase XerD
MVYGLRYYYRLLGMNKNAIALPSLKKETKLPVILNYQELKELFAAPSLLKQRIVLTLIYSPGSCYKPAHFKHCRRKGYFHCQRLP